jgi:hypothetical protein
MKSSHKFLNKLNHEKYIIYIYKTKNIELNIEPKQTREKKTTTTKASMERKQNKTT